MKNIFFIALISVALIMSCGENNPYNPPVPDPSTDSIPPYGTEGTFEVMSWNIQNYPKSSTTTINLVAMIIKELEVDIVALQEIESGSAFQTLLSQLENWQGLRSSIAHGADDLLVAYIYDPSVISVTNIDEIYPENSNAFPRAPFVLECSWNDTDLVIINNHFKCCGNGLIEDDEWDEERRRQAASESLQVFIEENYAPSRVILLGDLNDKINDPQYQNVFWNFISDPDHYEFIDMTIANGSNYRWSWGNGSSHLDHILITNELFGLVENISTIRLQDYFDEGWNEYNIFISDHIPVAVKFYFN